MFVYVMLGAGGLGLIGFSVYCKLALETWRGLSATTKDYDNLTTCTYVTVFTFVVLPPFSRSGPILIVSSSQEARHREYGQEVMRDRNQREASS
jgi:hypothetical protein